MMGIKKLYAALRRVLRRPEPSAPAPAAKSIDLVGVEARMKQLDHQVDIPVEHIFSAGVYIRQVTIPAGTLVMGKRHRNATCNILLKGKLAVYFDETKSPVVIEGPAIFTSEPGAKKFAYCIEPAVFANVIPTDETDPDEIERRVIIPEHEYQALKAEEEKKCLS
jgi:hypothetical protein